MGRPEPIRRRPILSALPRLSVYALVVAGIGAGVKYQFLAPREVSVAEVEARSVTAEVQGTGAVTTKVHPRVGTKINGRVEKVLVDEGAVVRAGDLVAVLEDSDLRHQVDRARARLEAAKATAHQTKQTWERTKDSASKGVASYEELDVAEEKYRVAVSLVRVEEAEVRYHEFKLTETKVTSSVSGVVTRRWVDPGDAIVSGQPVVTVADTTTVWVAANVDQRFAGKVRKGQPAIVVLRGRPGIVTEDRVGQTVAVEARVDAQCPARGCWLRLKDDAGDVMVDLAPGKLELGEDKVGQKARVTGEVVKKGGRLWLKAEKIEFLPADKK